MVSELLISIAWHAGIMRLFCGNETEIHTAAKLNRWVAVSRVYRVTDTPYLIGKHVFLSIMWVNKD